MLNFKVKYESRKDQKNRTKLETVIPLTTPYVVFFDIDVYKNKIFRKYLLKF